MWLTGWCRADEVKTVVVNADKAKNYGSSILMLCLAVLLLKRLQQQWAPELSLHDC